MDFTQTQSHTIVGGQVGFAVPLIVSVTGHRDLVPEEVPVIRRRVADFLTNLREEYPDRGVSIMSALAEGSDQLVAEEALRLGVPIIVPLPMERKIYIRDFESIAVQEKFEFLSSRAAETYELPLVPGNTRDSISEYGNARDLQYAQLGVFLCAHCHILLALWDGKDNDKLGGTGQVVRFHHDDVMPGYTTDTAGSTNIIADDESDLVYHIVCSRDRENGQPEESLEPGDCWWYSLDEHEPRSKEIPESHRRVFQFTSEFSKDALTHADSIRDGAWPLLDKESHKELPVGLRDIDHIFRAADWLAIYFQKRTHYALQATHLLALLMGLMYIGYSDVGVRNEYSCTPSCSFLFSPPCCNSLAKSIPGIASTWTIGPSPKDFACSCTGLPLVLSPAAVPNTLMTLFCRPRTRTLAGSVTLCVLPVPSAMRPTIKRKPDSTLPCVNGWATMTVVSLAIFDARELKRLSALHAQNGLHKYLSGLVLRLSRSLS